MDYRAISSKEVPAISMTAKRQRAAAEYVPMENLTRGLFYLLALGAGVGLAAGLWGFFQVQADYRWAWLIFSAAYALFAPRTLQLPNDAVMRPAIAMPLAAMLLLPPALTVLVPFPGLLLAARREGRPWLQEAPALGQMSLALFAGGHVYWTAGAWPLLQPWGQLPPAILALGTHLLLNRLAASVIMAHRQQKPLAAIGRLNLAQIGWEYFTVHGLGFLFALLYRSEGALGIAAAAIFLHAISRLISRSTLVPRLHQAALTDILTGAENRRAWEELVQRAPNFVGSLLLFDLDKFKAINDRYGHEKGDEVLQDFAAEIKAELRRDDRLFRLGGDEFAVLVPHGLEASVKVQHRVTTMCRRWSNKWQQQNIQISATFSRVVVPVEAASLPAALSLADKRLLEKKRTMQTGCL